MTPPIPGKRKRVLIVKLGAIGDVVMTLPAANLLHRSGCVIDWICGTAVAPLLQRYPWINPIVIDDTLLRNGGMLQRLGVLGKLRKRLRGNRYDLCACLYYDLRYRALTSMARAQTTLMLSQVVRDRMLLPGRHHTDEYARVMLTALSGTPDGERPDALAPVPLPRPEVAGPRRPATSPRIVLCPGGARNSLRDDPLRRWPLERYVELAAHLAAKGSEVLLIGGPDDAWVRPSFADSPVQDRIGRLSLLETVALLDDSDALVTHDTGPLHLAGLTSIAIVGLFGPTDPRTRLPSRPAVVGLWGGERFGCRPCYDGRDFAPCLQNGCMREIGVDSVTAALSALLGRDLGGVPRERAPVQLVRRF